MASCFQWNHNEFANIQTELLPIGYFSAVCLWLATETFEGAQAELQQAVLATTLGTVLQHSCSLVAHVFSCISPRLSHTIWYACERALILTISLKAPGLHGFPEVGWRGDKADGCMRGRLAIV